MLKTNVWKLNVINISHAATEVSMSAVRTLITSIDDGAGQSLADMTSSPPHVW